MSQELLRLRVLAWRSPCSQTIQVITISQWTVPIRDSPLPPGQRFIQVGEHMPGMRLRNSGLHRGAG